MPLTYHVDMTDAAFRAMSVADYLRTEELSPVKREYVGGFVYPLHAQAGASEAHVLISGNVAAVLHGAARRRGCRVYQSDMKLALQGQTTFFYPDVMVVCDGQDRETRFKTAPCVLVEVLSPSTASNDRVGKYTAYTGIASLELYLIVEQGERRVYAYQRGAAGWELMEVAGQGGVRVPPLEFDLTLDDVYAGVLS